MIKDMGKLSLFYVLLFLVCMFIATWSRVASADVFREPPKEQEQQQGQQQEQNQHQKQGQQQGQKTDVDVVSGGAELDNEIDLDLSDQSRVENNSSNVVLVPNNNTESCLRVFGISWGNGDGAGAFGIPWRAKACDFEQAADDAAASGHLAMAWYWRCHKKNLYKTFRIPGVKKSAEQLVTACHDKMSGLLEAGSLQADFETLQKKYDIILAEYQEANQYAVEQRKRLEEACEIRTNRALEACTK